MVEVEYGMVKSMLKTALKKRGLSYADLAAKMDVSEVTIKRLFSKSREGYSSKIFEICDAIDISFFDLVEMAKDSRRKHFALTPEQDRFFAKNIGYFAIFRELYRGRDFKYIKKTWKLTEPQTFKIFMQLEKLGLIEVLEKNKVRIIPEGVMELDCNSKTEIALRHPLTDPFLRQFDESYDENEICYINSEVEVSEENRKYFYKELKALSEKFCDLALRDKNLLPAEKLKSVRWFLCFSEYRTTWSNLKPKV